MEVRVRKDLVKDKTSMPQQVLLLLIVDMFVFGL